MSQKLEFTLSFLDENKFSINFLEDLEDIIIFDDTFEYFPENEDDLDDEEFEMMVQKENEQIKKKKLLLLECLMFNDKLNGIHVRSDKIFVVLRNKYCNKWKEVVCDILSSVVLVLNPNLVFKENKKSRLFSQEFLKNSSKVLEICSQKKICISLKEYKEVKG